MAFLIQSELERITIKRIKNLVKKTGIKNLVISGGVGLNCVLNGKLLKETGIKNIHVFPASGDTGQSIGNAIWAAFSRLKFKNKSNFKINKDYWGKKYGEKEIINSLKSFSKKIKYKKLNYGELLEIVSEKIMKGQIVFWFQGRSELGPRALGNRSILADPRNKKMKDYLNSKIKHREWFRPYCPSILEEFSKEYFEIEYSPFMNIAANVKKNKRKLIPAITHVDGTARIQTVSKEQNTKYYDLIKKFYEKTGIPILLNTSFNDSGEPIVESPKDAINSFLKMKGKILVIGDYLIEPKTF
ncbi:MAG: carbamoyltransferase C-terminal domain-containing protein [Nanoarchaeota archaeon]